MPHFLLEIKVQELPFEAREYLMNYWDRKYHSYLDQFGCNKDAAARRHANQSYWEAAEYMVNEYERACRLARVSCGQYTRHS